MTNYSLEGVFAIKKSAEKKKTPGNTFRAFPRAYLVSLLSSSEADTVILY